MRFTKTKDNHWNILTKQNIVDEAYTVNLIKVNGTFSLKTYPIEKQDTCSNDIVDADDDEHITFKYKWDSQEKDTYLNLLNSEDVLIQFDSVCHTVNKCRT